MKKIFRIALALFVSLLALSCTKEGVKTLALIDPAVVEGEMLLRVGDSHYVVLDVYPEENVEFLKWSSSDESVAYAEAGYVLAKSVGEATITAKSVNGKKIQFKVYVEKAIIQHWSASTSVTVIPGGQAKVSVTIKEPEGASAENLIPEITDDAQGYFSAWFQEGVLMVSCSSSAPADGSYKANLKLYDVERTKSTTTVLQAFYKKPTGVSVSPTSIAELMVGMEQDIFASVTPSDASNKDVEWKAEPDGIVNITTDGAKCTVTGASAGSVTVTATTVDGGKSASCTINVVEAYAKSLTAHLKSDYPLCVGGKTESSSEKEIGYTISPSFIPVTITNMTPDMFDVVGNVVKNAKKAGTGSVKVSGGGKEVILTVNVVGPNSVFALGRSEVVSKDGYYVTYRYIATTSRAVLPARYSFLKTIYGGEHLDASTALYLSDAFGFGKVNSVFSGSDWVQYEDGKETDPVGKAPAALGKTTTVTSTWGSKSASCKLTTAISSFTLGVQAKYSNGPTVVSGGTFTVSKSSVVSGTTSSYSSSPLLFVVNSTNVYIEDDSSMSAEMNTWADEFALKAKTAGDYELDATYNRVLFNPRTALGTYEFYLEKYPEVGFKIKLVN